MSSVCGDLGFSVLWGLSAIAIVSYLVAETVSAGYMSVPHGSQSARQCSESGEEKSKGFCVRKNIEVDLTWGPSTQP